MKKIQKIIFTLIYTLFVMAAGFAADFTWNGSNSSAWNASSNWTLSGTLPPGHPGYPSTSSDTAIITSNGHAPALNTFIPINLNSLKINSGSLNITGNTSLTLSGNFTHNGGTFSAGPNTTVTFNGSSSKITGTGGSEPLFGNLTVAANPAKLKLEKNIKIAGTFTKNGGFYANDYTTVTFTNLTSTITAPVNSEPTFWNLTIAGSAGLQLGSNIKVAGTFTNNGSFTHNSKAVTFVGFGSKITGTATETEFSTLAIDKRELPAPPPYNKVTLADGKKIKIKVFKNIYKGTFNAGSGTEITVTEEFDNTDGTFEPKTSTVKLIPSGNTVTITGTGNATDTKFYKLKLINGGNKTLKIKNKISVAEKGLELEGGTASPPSKDPLTVSPESAGEINFYTPPTPITGTPPKGKYLTVEAGIPIAGGTYTVVQSKPQGTPSANWIFEDCLINMTWTGGNSTQNWNDYANWSPNGIPGIHTPVTIQTTSRYPKLTANVSAESVTVNSGAELDLTHYTIKKGPPTAKLTNNGTIKMTGSGDQLSWFSAGNNDNITLGNTSTVEYYDAPPSNANVWAGPYENLKVSGTRQNLRALSITVNKDFTVASASFAQATGTFIFNGSSTIDGTGTISFYNLTVASSKSVTLNKDIAVGGAFINSSGATFNANGKNITFGGNFTNGGTFTPGTNTVTFNGTSTLSGTGAISFNNLSVASGKSVTLNKDITVGGAFINSSGATFNANGKNITFGGNFTNGGTFTPGTNTVTLAPSGNTVTITGTGTASNTKFHHLSLTGAGGKTLTINGKISVNGNLTLQGSGAADAQLLTIAGGTNSPGIELSADQTGNGKWLKVHTNVPMIPESGGKTYTVTESKAHEVSGFLISDGNPKNWIFSGYAGPMTWKGTHSSNWNGWQNWQPCGIPGVNSDVTIPQKEAAAHYPKLTAAGAQAKSVTVNSGAELDLGGQIIKKGTGSNDFTPLTNNGTLKMTGTSSASDPKGQKEWFENAIISFSDSSTVEYYGASPAASDIWAGPYQNLKVSGGKTSFTTGDLKVNEYFTVDTTGSFIINADSQSYTKMVTLNKSTTFSSTNAGGTVFESFLMTNGNTVDFSGNGKIETKKDIYGYGNINVISNTGGEWTSSEKIQANIINTQRKWTSLDNITANGSITANDWTAAGNVTLKGNLIAVQFNQTAGTLTFNGTGTPEQELKVTGAGDKKINHLTIDTGAKVKLGSEIEVKGTFLNKGTFTHNDKKVSFTGAASIGSVNPGQVTEFYDIEIASSASLTLNQDIKIKKDFSNSGGFTVNSKTVSFVKGSAPVSAASTISGNGVSFANLNIESGKTVTLNNDSLEISGTLTNDGIFDAQTNSKTVTFTGTNAKITRTQASPSPMPENKFHILKIADSATLKVVLSGINNNEHNKFVQIDIKNSFVNGQDGIFIPHFSNFVFSGTANTNSINHNINFTDITIPSTGSLTLNKPITVGGTFTSNGTFTAGANKVTFRGGNHGLEITKGTGSSGTMTFSEIEILGDAHLALKRDITVTEKIYYTEKNGNLGKFTADSGTTVTLNPPPGGTVTITGTGTASNTTFRNLSLTGAGGKTLTIDKKISVLGNLTLTGTSTDKLTIEGISTNSSIALTTANSAHGQYLKVRTNIPITGGTYTAEDSLPDGSDTDIQAGKPENWIFTNYNGTLTWKGSVDSNWNNRRNWEPALAIPGKNTDVTIPQKTESAHHYPLLSTNAEANTVTVQSNASLNIAGFVISDNSGRSPLTVHGMLKLKGTADQTNWFAAASPADKITLQNTSTVVYYDNSTANIWGGTYYKLQVQNRDKLVTGGAPLTVEGTFKVTHTTPPTIFEIDTGTGAQHYKGSITATGINLSFKTASLKTMKDTPANLTAVTAANITVNGDWTSNSTVNAQTVTVLLGGSWTSKKGTITLTGNLDAAKFVQTEGDLIFNGTGNRQLSTNSSDSKIKSLVINTNASVKLASDITIQGNFTNNGTFDATTAPGYTVTLTNDVNHKITGNTAAGAIGTQNNTDFHHLVCINAGGKQIQFNKKISVHGNLTLQGSNINNLLNISGTDNDAEIYVESNQGTASGYECKWLGVAENLPIKSLTSSTYTCTTDESKPTGNINSIIAGKPENWIFTNVYELRWTGEANDNNWNNPNNWRPRTSHAPKPTQFATVRAVAAGNHPILGSGDYYAKKVEVVGTATLDLADKLIYSNTAKTATAELTAKGTLRLKGTDDQKTWFEHSNPLNRMTITQNSTVEYYSAPTTIKLWGGGTDGYNKLILNNIGTCETENSNLKVNGELSVEGSNVTINSGNATQTYNGVINATGKDVTLEGSTITTKDNITANKIKVLGDWNSTSGTITASTNIEAAKWTSADGVITQAENNITVTGAWDSKGSTITANNIEAKKNWDSSGNVTSNGNIKVDNGYLWKPTAGDIKLKGNLTAGKFNQTGGTLTFNSTGIPEQELKFTGAGDKNIFNLTIDPGAKVKLGSEIEVKGTFLNNGTFNTGTGNTITFKGVSFTNNGTFTAGATNTVTLNPTGNTVTITGTGTASNTKFSNLECTTSTTSKTLNISGKISVTGDLILSGANGEPLTINGSNSAEIHLSNSHGLTSGTAKGNFLMIYTGKVRIQPTGKYYVVKDSKDDSGSTISKNGWIFVKPNLRIVNSFAKPNDNHIYLLFDDNSLSTEEFDSLKALNHSLQITDGVTTYTSNLQTVHKEPSSYIPSGHSLWKIQLDGTQKFNPDDILKSTYQVSLNYFGTLKHKAHISDIGIDMVKPLTASNSIVLRNFNAGDNDPALPTLDVRVLAEKAPSSSNVILHFFSKNSAEHKFWHPDTIPSPPGSFANPQAGTTNYSPTLNGNLITSIIPSTDPSLKEGKVGQFMYVYNNWLPCARLRNPNDILSFDVWNFKIVGVRMQKGGVSIFDNVVNPHKGQSATIAAHLKKSGMLTIQIMTLDGNIVRTLTRSHHNAGDHFYLWDGRNNGGNPVASGMYFVRIAGPDIDEVRKILIIK
ncbi:hypothetical protein H0R90_12140 [Treponema putidum]|uniref:FlgD immunoglobulin-like domain containing protein n=1 Tax=Treponema putidum TaxID=221027 RepID=UPI0004F85B26|nr:FlgD immunoglobulin-like domain containing protein [Treponema putidum]AIN93452.1 hypothetical protein JO40_04435 [Treponema putidum]TWI73097.1 FlgD-like protein [Treponema putidum]